jgi:hypothetical protein
MLTSYAEPPIILSLCYINGLGAIRGIIAPVPTRRLSRTADLTLSLSNRAKSKAGLSRQQLL